MNKIKSIIVAGLGLTISLASCDSGDIRRSPGHIYAPDMTYSRAYDAYTSNPNLGKDSLISHDPVAGTMARGHLYDHLTEGDTTAYKTFTTDMRFNAADLKEGGRLFNIYCGICHGTNLDGQGPLFASGKFASMPANFADAKYLHMPVGQMYAAAKYGKGMMGSYASQLDIKQRWMVISYIKNFQAGKGGDAFAFGDSTLVKPATPKADTAKAGAPVIAMAKEEAPKAKEAPKANARHAAAKRPKANARRRRR